MEIRILFVLLTLLAGLLVLGKVSDMDSYIKELEVRYELKRGGHVR